jgi:hypothetical protein
LGAFCGVESGGICVLCKLTEVKFANEDFVVYFCGMKRAVIDETDRKILLGDSAYASRVRLRFAVFRFRREAEKWFISKIYRRG